MYAKAKGGGSWVHKRQIRKVAYYVCILVGAAFLLIPWFNTLLPRGDRYISKHAASALPPLRGFAEDSPFNVGDTDVLDQYPGIGPVLAQRIIDERTAYGPYRLPEDLLAVKGIGPKTLSAMMDLIQDQLVFLTQCDE